MALVEALLKRPRRVDVLLATGGHGTELVTRFLTIALVSFTAYGIVIATLLGLVEPSLPFVPTTHWYNGSAFALIAAYDFGLIAACGICLPSFYFYNLLAGVRIAMVDVVAHAVKCLATSAIALFGILPIYLAVVLGQIVFEADPETLEVTLGVGLVLPFVAGLFGVASLYRGFAALAAHQRRRAGEADTVVREVFLGRLMAAWAGAWTAVSPVMIYTVWTTLVAGPGLGELLGSGR